MSESELRTLKGRLDYVHSGRKMFFSPSFLCDLKLSKNFHVCPRLAVNLCKYIVLFIFQILMDTTFYEDNWMKHFK